MASTILTNWTVYYSDDGAAGAGYKQIRWTGAGTPETATNSVNQLYSALSDLFSISSQNDANDTIPVQAVTPTVYNIGAFDAGDLEPWFIDPISIQHLTGGSLQTVNWSRDLTARTGSRGIYRIVRSGTNIIAGDVGATITHATGDSGTLLYVDGTNLWIRPTGNTSADDWTDTSGNITCNGHTDTQTAAGVTGERLWSNVYTIGTLESNTAIFIIQNYTKITSFWNPGHVDRLFLVNDGFASGLIDSGILTVYARQYSKLYDHFQSNVSAGGSNPIPLSTTADINNTTGVYQTVFADSSGTWTVGHTFTKNGDATRQGTVTKVTGSNPTITIQYYLSSTALTAFSNSDAVTSSGSATGTIVTPTNIGPANLSPNPTFTFGAASKNIGDGAGNQPYDVVIDVGGNTLANFYEYTKYLTRRGSTTSLNGHDGEQYISTGTIKFSYDGETSGPFQQGETLTGTGVSGVLVSLVDNGATGTMVVRDVRGTFSDNIHLTGGTSGAQCDVNGTVTDITIIKTSPFGTFAGGNFFGARGVWIENMHANDANKYQLIDSNNVSRTPPATVSVAVSGLVSGDTVSVFRSTGSGSSTVDKTYLHSHATSNSAATTSWTTDASTPIPNDTPSAGFVRLVKTATGTEERIQYTSWSGNIFTLSSSHAGGYGASDRAYVPFIDTTASGTSVSVSVQYTSDRDVVTRVRTLGIQPFSTTGTLTNTGYSATAIRTPDSIA